MLRIIAVTFFVLAANVLVGSIIDLATQAHPERSPVGIGLTVASLLIMPLLGWRKRHVGSALHNQLVLADAAETILCAILALTTLLGLVLFAAFGWWWADPVAALAVAWFAVREGREAWHGELGLPLPIAVPEAAKLLGISRAAAYGFASTGDLPTKRLGRRVYVISAKLRDFIETEGEAA